MPAIFNSIPDYYGGVSLIFWFISIAIYVIGFFLFIKEAAKTELMSLKMSHYAYGVFLLLMACTRIFFIIGYYLGAIPGAYDFYTSLGYISGTAGLIFWIWVLEKYLVQKTKKIFTLITLFSFSFSIFALFGIVKRSVALNFQYILLPFAIAVILILYIYLIKKTTGTVRRKVEGILFGLFLILLGQVMDGETFISALPTFPLLIAPIIMITGIITFFSTQLFYKR